MMLVRILSFFCPCMMWGQVVVRSQIPLLIGMKNTLGSQVGSSGYNCFMNSWMIMVVIPAGLFLGGIFTEGGLQVFLFAAFSVFFIIFLYINGHVRTAFKMKYACRTFSVCGSVLWPSFYSDMISLPSFRAVDFGTACWTRLYRVLVFPVHSRR
jgi:hypothetical protein